MEKMTISKVFGYTVAIGVGLQVVKKAPIIVDMAIAAFAKSRFPELYNYAVEKVLNKA